MGIILLAACKKQVTSCINMPRNTFYRATAVPFNSCSKNAVYYFWEFGDGHSSNGEDVFHNYADTGTYYITLTVQGKNAMDIKKSDVYIYIIDSVKCGFDILANPVALGEEVPLHNTSVQAVKYHWDFGNGQTSALQTPAPAYNAPGTYNITLTASSMDDSITCSQTKSITVDNCLYHSGVYRGTDSCSDGYINHNYQVTYNQNGPDIIVDAQGDPLWTAQLSCDFFHYSAQLSSSEHILLNGTFEAQNVSMVIIMQNNGSNTECDFSGTKIP